MTTDATVNVTGDEVVLDDGDRRNWPEQGSGYAVGLERVQVSFPAEDGGDATCRYCHETIYQESVDPAEFNVETAWILTADDDGFLCSARDPFDAGDKGAVDCYGHEPDNGPGSWCNSASVSVDEDENSVTVGISVGDPRGAFTMTVRRVDRSGYCKKCGEAIHWCAEHDHHEHQDTTEDENDHDAEPDGERLLLHVPYVGMGWAHAELTQLHDGTFLVGA